MSEEEKDGEVYVRHAPAYRSDSLNRFILKLDHRLDTDIPKKASHPRLDRRVGSPRDKPIPRGCKKWIIKKEVWANTGEEANGEANEQGDASDSDPDELC